MLQRNSSTPCYYVCLSPLLLVMRTGSQRRNNLSDDLLAGSRLYYFLEKRQENELVFLVFVEQAFDPELGTLTQRLVEHRRLTLHCSVNSTE